MAEERNDNLVDGKSVSSIDRLINEKLKMDKLKDE